MPNDPGLRRLALRTLLAAFPGTVAPQWAGDLLADGLAGHTLFGGNITDADQVTRLTAQLRSARADTLIAIDEEGGDVTRLGHRTGSPYPGNAALGAAGDPDLTRRVYAAIGADLAATGINLDLAPTVDVNTAADNPIIGTRSFGADPALVARHTAAAVHGLQSAGIAACAKHFPGHGATVTDSHLELPTVDVPLDLLRARDLPPFAAAVEAGVRAVMSAHIRVPALTGDGPATFSRAALTDLLRNELGFRGAIVTDALEMRGAAASAGGIPRAAVAALAAGADLLCIGAVVDLALVEAVVAEIALATTDGRLPLHRLEDAATRTTALTAETPRQENAATRTTETPGEPDEPFAASHRPDFALGVAAAHRGMIVEGAVGALRDPLVVRFVAGWSIAAGKVPWGLTPHLATAEEIEVVAADTTAESVLARAGQRPVVFLGRRIHNSAAARELIEKVAADRPAGVVEMGWPSSWRPAGTEAFIVTHGSSLANSRAAAEALALT
ncbi:glycoside hydrolase family 3 N-terminal domain-containing protein [Actinoplanes derwentensis]|uniref:Beta-N-acetylhexosaminidase n=1 Tax=Actinoplanes derwentensis TaxID=113562 RepID=A0A1H2D534_9ACTN|nr:glycoside hydrolase family 3 N-terminal domain-containing protein [Actinoplanes derwentensis]GID85972.1 beta-N-acetylhexosaminidase [Actinoplanes derwentensis]SDT77356.1 beta-N-acetylhexosaminidase [Actinoplanes derwentensis]